MRDATLDAHAHAAYVKALQHQLEQATGRPVARIETHISSLLLTPQTVYKLKKPVRLPFVDFSTAQRREHFCREELRLNRRLAPQLYLDVVAISGRCDAPRLGGDGDAIDHAVRMRRFPADALLSQRLADGRLQPQHIDRLAHTLARFHATAPCAAPNSGFATPAAVIGRLHAVLRQLGDSGADVRSLQQWVAVQGTALRPAFEQRRATQAVRECHGDLHLSNTVLLDDGEVTAFDCIEFDPSLRWIDVMDDLAFATMDLQAHGRADLAWRLLDAYLQERGDHAGLPVLHFYEVGRALVRALVARLTPAPDSTAPPCVDYLALAHRLAQEAPRGPGLAVMCGLSGSGKSALAGALLELAGAVRLRSDVERKRLFGLSPLQRSRDAGLDLYTPRATQDTFDRLRDLARQALLAGYPVIVDAAFLQRSERETFHRLADELRLPFTVIHCMADMPTLRERVTRRAAEGVDSSEATAEVLDRQLRDQEPPDSAEQAWTLRVDTGQPVDAAAVLARWRAMARACQR
ncbi:bifunctional aminoglycoside phosphotransferase/ATP-binding protein [Sphaerotilaceae bacterium SBD11-9]